MSNVWQSPDTSDPERKDDNLRFSLKPCKPAALLISHQDLKHGYTAAQLYIKRYMCQGVLCLFASGCTCAFISSEAPSTACQPAGEGAEQKCCPAARQLSPYGCICFPQIAPRGTLAVSAGLARHITSWMSCTTQGHFTQLTVTLPTITNVGGKLEALQQVQVLIASQPQPLQVGVHSSSTSWHLSISNSY